MQKRLLLLGLALIMLVSAGCGQQGDGAVEALDDLLLRVYLALHREDISRTASDDPAPVVFVVQPGDTAGDIGLRLKRLNLIVDAELFGQLAKYENADSKLEAGHYWVVDADIESYLETASYYTPVHESSLKRVGCASNTLMRRPLRFPRRTWTAASSPRFTRCNTV